MKFPKKISLNYIVILFLVLFTLFLKLNTPKDVEINYVNILSKTIFFVILAFIIADFSLNSFCYFLAKYYKKLPEIKNKSFLIYSYAILSGIFCGTSWTVKSEILGAVLCFLSALFFILLIRKTNKLKPFFLSGIILNLIGFHWLYNTIHDFGQFNIFLSTLFFLLFLLYSSLQFIAFAFVYRYVCKQEILSKLNIAISLSFVLVEYLFPKVFPWKFGYAQIGLKWLSLSASVGGIMLVTFLTFALTELFIFEFNRHLTFHLELRKIKQEKFQLHKNAYDEIEKASNIIVDKKIDFIKSFPIYIILIPYVLFLSFNTSNAFIKDTDSYPQTRVTIVQARPTSQIIEGMKRILPDESKYIELTNRAIKHESSSLIIWPESTLEYEVLENISNIGENIHNIPFFGNEFPLLSGIIGYLPENKFYNAAFLVGKNGFIDGFYNKQKLILFGEYIPLVDTFPSLKKIMGIEQPFQKGKDMNVFSYKDENDNEVRVSSVICFEEVVPSLFRRASNLGANLFVGMSNDGWFGNGVALFEHNKIAAFRAIENNKYLIRSTHTGLTSIIDNLGNTILTLPIYKNTYANYNIPLISENTIYSKTGDILFILLNIFTLIIFLMYFFKIVEK